MFTQLRGYIASGALMGVIWPLSHGEFAWYAFATMIPICAVVGGLAGALKLGIERAAEWPPERKARHHRNIACIAIAVAVVAVGFGVWDATGRPVATGAAMITALSALAAVWSAGRALLIQR